MQMVCYKTNSDNKISLSNDGNEEAVKARRNRTRRQPNCGMITTWHGEAVCFYSHPSSASQSVMLATVPPRKRPFSRQSCKTKLSSQEVFRSNLSSICAFTPPELSELEIKQSQHFLAEKTELSHCPKVAQSKIGIPLGLNRQIKVELTSVVIYLLDLFFKCILWAGLILSGFL